MLRTHPPPSHVHRLDRNIMYEPRSRRVIPEVRVHGSRKGYVIMRGGVQE